MYKCLVIEDDLSIRNLMRNILKNEYECYFAGNGYEGINLFTRKNPDIIVLDLGLPDMDGEEVLSVIRSWSTVPVLVVTARSDDKSKVQSLDNGADDYITKPFSIDELLARLRVIKRRIELSNKNSQSSDFENKDLVIDYGSHIVRVNNKEVHLTPSEYKILELLSKNVTKVVTYNEIILNLGHSQSIYEYDIATLRVFMAGLRKKIEEDPAIPKYIVTVLGCGYRMPYND